MLCSLYSSGDAEGHPTLVHAQTTINPHRTRFPRYRSSPMHNDLITGLSTILGDSSRVITAPSVLDRLSHDFYWYSPVLRPMLAAKNGEVAVQPISADEVLAILRFAGRHEIPVTARGAGTGNYGQCVPLEGGIVLDLSLMDKLEDIT